MDELLELLKLWDDMEIDASEFYQAWGNRVAEIRVFLDTQRTTKPV